MATVLVSAALFGGCRGPMPQTARVEAPERQGSQDAVDAALARLLDAGAPFVLSLPGPVRDDLRSTYASRQGHAAWHASGRLNADGEAALRLLNDAAADGLTPDDYLPPPARDLSRTAASPDDRARLDATLTAGMLRLFRDLHLGRVAPRALGVNLPPADAHDFAAVLARALDAHRVPEAVAAMRPELAQYEALRAYLADYRRRAAVPDGPLLPAPAKSVHVGDPYPAAGALAARLVAVGDLEAAPPSVGPIYSVALAAAVARFQARHGLDADGILGLRTVGALNVPLAWRLHQIELSLERLRWLPDLGDGPMIAINIPMFHLWAWDREPARQRPVLDMAVIVGRALTSETPVIDHQLRSVIFRPYWNVPRSILQAEVLPKIEKDPAYLAAQDMEIVRGKSDSAVVVDPTPDAIAELRRGALRVRQRPGPKNALGYVKFVFPNDESIYMHGTPATELFRRTRRDFSHGCVRVERPTELAAWVLRALPEWTPDRIRDAMNGTGSDAVRLPKAIRVVLFYTTAAVLSSDGALHFADDIYNHDRPLDLALRRAARP